MGRRRWRRMHSRRRRTRRSRWSRRRRTSPAATTFTPALRRRFRATERAKTFGLTAIKRSRRLRRAFLNRSLIRLPGDTVLTSVHNRLPSSPHGGTHRLLAGKVIKRISKVLQIRQLTNTRRNNSGQLIMRNVKLLQFPHTADRRR